MWARRLVVAHAYGYNTVVTTTTGPYGRTISNKKCVFSNVTNSQDRFRCRHITPYMLPS